MTSSDAFRISRFAFRPTRALFALLKPTVEEAKLLWRLARVKMVLFSASSLWMCWATATNSIDLSKLGWWDWFQTIGGCLGSWCIAMMAFVDRSAAQVAAGRIPALDSVPGETEDGRVALDSPPKVLPL